MQEEINWIVKKKKKKKFSAYAYWEDEKACPKENTKNVAKQPFMHHVTTVVAEACNGRGIIAPETLQLGPEENRKTGPSEGRLAYSLDSTALDRRTHVFSITDFLGEGFSS